MTTDPPVGQKFYTELLGWTAAQHDMGTNGMYTMLSVASKGIGGIVPMEAKDGLPSHWITYISVPGRLEETLSKIESLGGRVHFPPIELPGVGRFTVASDPQGAVFSPFEEAPLEAGQPAQTDQTPEGDFCWTELLTTDAAAASEFYSQVFGYKINTHDFGPAGGLYYLLLNQGKDIGGAMNFPPGMPGKPHWLPYVFVADVDAKTTQAESLGAQICSAPRDIPGIGRFSIITDPTGASFALYKNAQHP